MSISFVLEWLWGLPAPVWVIVFIIASIVALKTWPVIDKEPPSGMTGEELLELERIKNERIEKIMDMLGIYIFLLGTFGLLPLMMFLGK